MRDRTPQALISVRRGLAPTLVHPHGRRAVMVVGVVALLSAATALAAAPERGALYSGYSNNFTAPKSRIAFRVSHTGHAMSFAVRRTRFTVSCYKHGKYEGGGEAVVVRGKPTGPELHAPLVTIHKNGTFSGAGVRRWKPTEAPEETDHYHFTGRFTGSGSTAVGKLIVDGCFTPKFTLKAQ